MESKSVFLGCLMCSVVLAGFQGDPFGQLLLCHTTQEKKEFQALGEIPNQLAACCPMTHSRQWCRSSQKPLKHQTKFTPLGDHMGCRVFDVSKETKERLFSLRRSISHLGDKPFCRESKGKPSHRVASKMSRSVFDCRTCLTNDRDLPAG